MSACKCLENANGNLFLNFQLPLTIPSNTLYIIASKFQTIFAHAMSSSTQVISEYPAFKGTPPEVQSRIWEFAMGLDGGRHVIDLIVERTSVLGFTPDGVVDPMGAIENTYTYRSVQQPNPAKFLLINKDTKKEVERLLKIRTAPPDGRGDVFLQFNGGQKIYFEPSFDTFYIDLESILNLLFFFLDEARTNLFEELGDVPEDDRLGNSSGFDRVQNLAIPHLQPNLLRCEAVDWITGRGNIFRNLSPSNGVSILPLLRDRGHKSVFAIICGLEAELRALRNSISFSGGNPENQEVRNMYSNVIARVEGHVRNLIDV